MGMFTEEPMFEDPNLPPGWYRKVVQRQTGATAGQWDVYVYNPDGKKFRSRNELRTHLLQTASSLNSDDFDFSVKGKAGGASASGGGAAKDGGAGDAGHATIRGSASASHTAAPLPPSKKRVRKRKLPAATAEGPTPEAAAGGGRGADDKIAASDAAAAAATALEISKYFRQSVMEKAAAPTADPRVLWHPPPSPYQLIQEQLYHDPWRLLVATIFLNKTSGKAATPLVWKFFERWPDAHAAKRADPHHIAALMQPLGLHQLRATRIIRMSKDYVSKAWQEPTELHGISKYGRDSFQIFCRGQWKEARPSDIMLRLYQDWIFTNRHVLRLEPQ